MTPDRVLYAVTEEDVREVASSYGIDDLPDVIDERLFSVIANYFSDGLKYRQLLLDCIEDAMDYCSRVPKP